MLKLFMNICCVIYLNDVVKREWVSTDISDNNDDNVECIILSTRMLWLYRSAESSELDSSW